MSCTTCLVGDRTTITLATSGFTAAYTRIGGPEFSREVVVTDVLGVATCVQKCLSDRIDYGEMEMEFCMDPDVIPPFSGEPETAVLTWPPKTGQTNGATMTAKVQARRVKFADAVPKDRMLSQMTLVIICDPTPPVFAAGS